MGKYYALAQGEDLSVAAASEEHYKPAGPADRVPTDPVSVAVALADKLDTLVGFWAIDEKPTGSKDPYALRRAALGVISLITENHVRLALTSFTSPHFNSADRAAAARIETKRREAIREIGVSAITMSAVVTVTAPFGALSVDRRSLDLLSFFADRL